MAKNTGTTIPKPSTRSIINKKQGIIKFNFWIIRELYIFMSNVDGIPNAMKRFYRYLGTTEEGYNSIVNGGIITTNSTVVQKLKDCGYSERIFNASNPVTIQCSDFIKNHKYDKDIQKFLDAELRTKRDVKNALLVICTRLLILQIMDNSTHKETISHFLSLLSQHKFDENNEIDNYLQDIYNQYLEIKGE